MVHARNNIVVNSTCHFQTLALGIPPPVSGAAGLPATAWCWRPKIWQTPSPIKTARDGERYLHLCHLMSRRMAVPDFANPSKLESLMEWLTTCDDVLTAGDSAMRG